MAGYKQFSPDEYLTAADIQAYLMNQQVMVFAAGTAARASALGTAAAEGMVTYIGGESPMQVYDGATWKAWP